MMSNTHRMFNFDLGETADAIRETARTNNLPIDSITAVSVLDPYFYRG